MAISALNTALSSLLTHQRAIQVLSENVANAENEDYTRKIANLSPVLAGDRGGGVQISSIERVVDEFLIAERRLADASAQELRAVSDYLREVVSLYGTVEETTSLAARTADLAEKIQFYAENGNDPAAAADVVASAQLLTGALRSGSARLNGLRTRADQEISETVNRINTLLREIDVFNVDILRARAVGERLGAHNDLLDRRDVAINELSGLIDVQVSRQGDGTVILTTVGGRLLLDIDARTVTHTAGNELTSGLRYDPDAIRPTSTDSFVDGIFVGNDRSERSDITREITTGKLRGLIDLRDEILPNLSDQLDEFTRVLRDEVNRVHNQGSGWPPASRYVGKAFTTNDNQPVTSLALAEQVGVNFTGLLQLSVVRRGAGDTTGEVISTFTLDFDNGVYAVVGGTGNRTANLAKAVQALQGLEGDNGQTLDSLLDVGFDASGRLFLTAEDPLNHGVVIHQPTNFIRSNQLVGATRGDVLNGAVNAGGGTFDILDTRSNQVLASIQVNATTNFRQLLEILNEVEGINASIVGQEDVSGLAVGTALTGTRRYFLDIAHTDGRRLEIRDTTNTVAQTLQITDDPTPGVPTPLTGQRAASNTRFALTRRFSSLTATLDRLDTRRTAGEVTPSVGGNIVLTIALASDPANTVNVAFDPTTSTLNDIVDLFGGTGISVGGRTVTARIVNEDGFRISIQSQHESNDELVFTGDGARYLGLDASQRPTDSRSFSHFFGLNDFFSVTGAFSQASRIDVAGDILSDNSRVSIRRPNNGAISGGGLALASADSRVGAEIFELFSQDRLYFRSVGNPRDRFYISATEGRLQELSEGIVSSVSTGIRSVNDTRDFNVSRAEEINRRVQSVSGVNLEEELLRLEQYSYAYNAARRVLESVAQLFDQLLNIRF